METRVSLPFADGEYEFWVSAEAAVAIEWEIGRLDANGIKQPRSLFEIYSPLVRCLASMGADLLLVDQVPVTFAETRGIIKQALIAGGGGVVDGKVVDMNSTLAGQLVKTYCYPNRPAIYDLEMVLRIVDAAVNGIPADLKKKDVPESAPSHS